MEEKKYNCPACQVDFLQSELNNSEEGSVPTCPQCGGELKLVEVDVEEDLSTDEEVEDEEVEEEDDEDGDFDDDELWEDDDEGDDNWESLDDFSDEE